jgi:hypothetical protein
MVDGACVESGIRSESPDEQKERRHTKKGGQKALIIESEIVNRRHAIA